MKLLLFTLFLCFCCCLLPETVSGQKYNALLGKRFRFKSKNFPTHYFRHRSYQMWLDRFDSRGLYILDSSFDIVPGLAGVGISFRSKNYPDHYIRHSSFLCFIHKFDGKDLFRRDASWIPREGLADRNGVSFESVNFPGHFMRHQGYRVRINRIDGSQLFRLDATWLPVLLKNVAITGEWSLVYGSNNAVSGGQVSVVIEEGITVGNTRTTSLRIENSWSTSVEAAVSGSFFGIGASLKTMFTATGLRSITYTSTSSWTKQTKVTKGTTITLVKGVPLYYWQYCVHATTADAAYITSKTNIYHQTSTRNPPALPN